ncbi:hypothetical protein JYU11_01305 [bacterium AH-315-G05]|nr:hypothetical protein [bacterium AH-315-L21]MBN4069522.1 hypothetical protein [bacterium AH-315-G05]
MKKKYFILALVIFSYVVVFLFCRLFLMRGSPMFSYTANWVARQYFLYIWVASILFAIYNLYIASLATTLGSFVGIILGHVIGGHMKAKNLERLDQLIESGASAQEIQALHSNKGVYIWLLTILIACIIGLFFDILLKKIKNKRISDSKSRA